MYRGNSLLLNSNRWIVLSNKKLEDVRQGGICLLVVLMRVQNLSKTTDNHLFLRSHVLDRKEEMALENEARQRPASAEHSLGHSKAETQPSYSGVEGAM